ncbi:MAG TPA: response regulator [Burkholderiaceae bacterium]|jgi:signal transduction histidine kinase/DNA-binding response OmpR family regulator
MAKNKSRRITLSRLILLRLAVAYLLLGLAVFGLQTLFEYRAQRALIVGELDRLANSFGPILSASAWDFQESAVADIVSGIGRHPDVVEVQMRVSSSFPSSQWNADGAGSPTEKLSVHYPLRFEDKSGATRSIGTLSIESSQDILWGHVIEELRSTALLIASLMAVVALAVWWLVHRSVVLPLTHLAEHLQGIDSRELLDARAMPRALGREFDILRLTFAGVFRQAARSRAQLQQSHDELEARVDERTHELQLANRAKSQFLANMSHEIRTPLNAVLGMLALLKRSELHPRQADYAVKGEGAARALLGLINDVLDFSKIEAGKMTLDPQPWRFDQLFRDLSVVLASNLGIKPVEVLFDVDPRLPEACVFDAMRLQQVLINLGGNAIKFTGAGEVVVAARLLEQHTNMVRVIFEVVDTGIGIAPENQALIFEAFTQADAGTARRFGGTGLGVAICQRIVTLMGGELMLESTLGLGSRFHFTLTLPLAPTLTAQAPARSTPRKVLVVDDNPMALDILCRMAESLGWEAARALSAQAGLDRLYQAQAEGWPFEAAFVDWQMEGMDGWDLCRAVRSGPHPAPVIVMVTAHGREELAHRSSADQALLDGYLVKPVTASMLEEALHSARQVPAAAQGVLEHRLQGLSLLVVDDNGLNQQVALELLESEGARVMAAGNGREALEVLALPSMKFDLVLMDMQMPEMDGLEATRRLRRDLGLTEVPVIALTANALASDREACLAAGMNAHVGKPFDLEELVTVIRTQTGRADAASAGSAGAAGKLPPQAVDAAQSAGVRLSEALERMGEQSAIYARSLQVFVESLPDMARQLHAALAGSQTDQARRLAHSLKGQAATLGVVRLAEQAAEAERAFGPNSAHSPAAQREVSDKLAASVLAARPLLAGLVLALATEDEAEPPSTDHHALRAALSTLAEALRESDMLATDLMLALRQRFHHELGAELNTLDQAVTKLDFTHALAQVDRYLEAYAE